MKANALSSDEPPTHLSLVQSGLTAQEYQRQSKSANTLRAYRSDWADFEHWCSSRGLTAQSATPDVVASYFADIATTRKTGTVERRLTAISYMRRKAGEVSPAMDARVLETLRGIRKVNGIHQDGKDALSVSSVREPGQVSKAFPKLLMRAGLPRIRFHDLRHTTATLLLSAGIHAKVVSERLGHATINITLDTYSHVLPDLQEEAAAAMDIVLKTRPEDGVEVLALREAS